MLSIVQRSDFRASTGHIACYVVRVPQPDVSSLLQAAHRTNPRKGKSSLTRLCGTGTRFPSSTSCKSNDAAPIIAVPCIGQSSSQKVSLDLATVTIWLGMPRQEVINKCAAAGFKQLIADKDGITFQNGDQLYWTKFKDDRLTFASLERSGNNES